MVNMIIKSLLIVGVLASFSCNEDSPRLIPKPDPIEEKQDKVNEDDERIRIFNPQVDILFVVDDSGSMSNFQRKLSENLGKFIERLGELAFLDYHIGFTTSDTNAFGNIGRNGALINTISGQRFVNRFTPDLEMVLRSTVDSIGINGSVTEAFFGPVKMALSEPNLSGVNVGFYREAADLVVVFLTDAEDQSYQISTDEFHEFLLDLKSQDKNKVSIFSIIIPEDFETAGVSGCSRDHAPAAMITDVTRRFEGRILNLCIGDYGEKLLLIGSDILRKMDMFLPLDVIPGLETIEVKYGEQIIPQDRLKGWSYSPYRGGLEFGPELRLIPEGPGVQVEVKFKPANNIKN